MKFLPEVQFLFWICLFAFFGIAVLLWKYLESFERRTSLLNVQTVPEPGTLVLLGTGLLAVRCKRKL